MKIDRRLADDLKLSSRGSEKQLCSIFEGCERVSRPLFDMVEEATGSRIELKKQKNLQWFDIGKYHNLSENDKEIKMCFVLHDGARIDRIFSIPLGEFLDVVLGNEKFRKHGWTKEAIETSAKLKSQYPSFQAKAPLKVREFYNSHSEMVNSEYEREDV